MTQRKRHPADPTSERTADQSTQSASGLSGGRSRRPDVASEGEADDILNRNRVERYDTPRQYEDEDR